MSQDVGFDLIFATTSSGSKHAEDVTRDLKNTERNGWMSKKFCLSTSSIGLVQKMEGFVRRCKYPQTMVFQLIETANIMRVELRFQENFVPQRIEVQMATMEESAMGSQPGQVLLEKLKYETVARTAFLPPGKSDATGAEKRLVYVDKTGDFIKLVFHKNHPTDGNRLNQVGLHSVSFRGYTESKLEANRARDETADNLMDSEDEECDKHPRPPACPGHPRNQIGRLLHALKLKKDQEPDMERKVDGAIQTLEKTQETLVEYIAKRREAGRMAKPIEFVLDIDRRGKKELNYGVLTSGVDDIFDKNELRRLGVVEGMEVDVCLRHHCKGLDCARQPKKIPDHKNFRNLQISVRLILSQGQSKKPTGRGAVEAGAGSSARGTKGGKSSPKRGFRPNTRLANRRFSDDED